MRITSNMLIRDMIWNMSNNLNTMAHSNKQLGTGKRVFKPSDDPVGITRILKYRTDIRTLAQYQSTIKAAQGHMDVTETSLTTIKDMMQRIRELTVQAANETTVPKDTEKIALEIRQLKNEIISVGNATNASKYIFSGLETNKKLFNIDGSLNINLTTERMHNRESMTHEVAVGEIMKTGSHPIDIFGAVKKDNFITKFIPRGTAESTPGKRAEISFDVDTDKDFSSDTITVQYGGTDYNVDTSQMTWTHLNPMDKKRFVESLKLAKNAGGEFLSTKADIFFDENDKLIIRSKTAGAGAGTTLAITENSAHITNVQTVAGVDSIPGSYTGTTAITDAEIAAETGKHEMVFILGEKEVKIEIDFAGINDAAGLQNALNTKLDASFPPAGTIVATVNSGDPISFNLPEGKLKIDTIISTKTEMITDLESIVQAAMAGDSDTLNKGLKLLDNHMDKILSVMGEVGAKTNRLKFIKERNVDNNLTFTKLLTGIENIDYGEAIMLFKNLENVYRASLAVGSKVVQPSLVDFLR